MIIQWIKLLHLPRLISFLYLLIHGHVLCTPKIWKKGKNIKNVLVNHELNSIFGMFMES